MPESKDHLHFLGIAGHTMRGIALAARELGYTVTGTDQTAYPPGSDWLDEQGFTWWREPDHAHLEGVTAVVVTGVDQAEAELAEAARRGLPIKSSAELIGELTKSAKRIIVSGTHGKTTTTSLIAWILEMAGRKPDFLVGIQPNNFETSVRLTGSDVAVLEGDEYRSSQRDRRAKFEFYKPDRLVITSIEMDHPDFFKDLDEIKQRFAALAKGLPADGQLYYWQGSEAVREVAEGSAGERHGYDFEGAEWQAADIRYEADGIRFKLRHHDDELGELKAPLYGQHNVLNILAAAAVTLGEGISLAKLQEALAGFKGASRRFERVSAEGAAVTVIDDYAHHPTEAATTIKAVKLHFPGRVIAVYKPHTYSRTEKLLREYHGAFADADVAFITEIESAREEGQTPTVSSQAIADGAGDHVRAVDDRTELLEQVSQEARPGDTILSMSVNGNERFAQELSQRLMAKEAT